MQQRERIIVFDGICRFCNKAVDILIRLDKHKRFRYTSIQGKFVKTLNIQPDIDSIIFYEDGIFYYKSTAILKILKSLGGIWVISQLFYLIPKFIRDFMYDSIAKYRYKVFGKRELCRVPHAGEEALFID